MVFEFRLPDIDEDFSEAVLVDWLVDAGESVEAGQSIVEFETERGRVEIPTPVDGIVIERCADEGEKVSFHAIITRIERESKTDPEHPEAEMSDAERSDSTTGYVDLTRSSDRPLTGRLLQVALAIEVAVAALFTLFFVSMAVTRGGDLTPPLIVLVLLNGICLWTLFRDKRFIAEYGTNESYLNSSRIYNLTWLQDDDGSTVAVTVLIPLFYVVVAVWWLAVTRKKAFENEEVTKVIQRTDQKIRQLSTDHPLQVANEMLARAKYLDMKGEYDEAIETAERALAVARKESDVVPIVADSRQTIVTVAETIGIENPDRIETIGKDTSHPQLSEISAEEELLVDPTHEPQSKVAVAEAAELLKESREQLRDREFAEARKTAKRAKEQATGVVDRLAEEAEKSTIEAQRRVEDGDFSGALEHWEETLGTYDDALELALAFDQNADLIRERITHARRGRRLTELKKRVSEAEALLEAEEFQTAETSFDELVDDLETTDIDRPDEIQDLERRTKTGYLEAQIEQIRRKRDRARRQFEAREYYEAREAFEDVRESIEPVLSLASRYGLTEHKEELLRLDEQCRTNATETRQALYETGVDAPDLTPIDEVEIEDGLPASAVNQPAARGNQRTREPGRERPTPAARTTVEDDLKAELPEHEVIEHVGSGGNADVHRISLAATGDVVALKVPQWQDTLSTRLVEEFMQEARTWDRLDDHPNIVDVVEYGSEPYPWLLMEYMAGGNMTARSAPAPAEAIGWMVDLCNATHHAHQRGVAHTDLKPENIMFTRDGDGGMVKVGDWGLAKVMLEHSASIEGMTPAYAAPEQVDPEAYGGTGPATDVYQIGVIAYELLTGEPLFDYDSHAAVMNAIISNEPTPPSARDPSLPPAADDVLGTALAKSKADRYESVLYLRDRLQDVF